MNKILYFFFILIIFLSFLSASLNATSKQSSFNNLYSSVQTNTNDSVWTIHTSTYMSMKEQNGIFIGSYNHNAPQVNEWRSAYASKSLYYHEGLQIDTDFSFNFALMGEIDLVALGNNDTSPLWVVGYSDGWSAHNGVPFTESYQSDNTMYPQSFPITDPDRNTVIISTSSGSGHIRVHYISTNSINATVNFAGEEISRILPVAGPIDTLRISMSAAGSYNSATDVWEAFNYKEDTVLQNIILKSTTNSSLNSPTQKAIIVGILGFSAIVIIFVIAYYSKFKIKRYNSTERLVKEKDNKNLQNNQTNYIKKLQKPVYCFNCLQEASPADIFCQNCGSRLK